MLLKKLIYILFIFLASTVACTRLATPSEKYSKLINTERRELSRIDTNEIAPLAKEFIIRGSAYQAQLYFSDAILEFMDALRFDSSAAILYMIAKNYKEIGKLDQSLNYALKALDKNPNFIPSMELLSEIYILRYEATNAITIYKNIVALEPKYERKLHLAKLYEMKDPREALKIYEQLTEIGDEITVLNRMAAIYSNLKNDEKYIRTLIKIRKLKPSDFGALQKLNRYYLDRGHWIESLSILDDADKYITQPDLDIFYIAFAQSASSDTSRIPASELRQFIDKVDNRFYFVPLLLTMSGRLALTISDTVTAEKFFENTLKTTDSKSDFNFFIAQYFLYSKKPEKTVKILKDCLQSHLNDSRYYSLYGSGLIESKNFEDAKFILQAGLTVDDSCFECLNQLGYLFDKSNKIDSMIYYYEKALGIHPDDPLLNNNYAYSLASRKLNLEKALQMSNIAIMSDSSNFSFLDTYGWINFELKNYGYALEYIRRAIEKGANVAEVFEHLGDIYIELKSKESAKKAYLEGLKIEPKSNSLLKKLEKL
ncbi:MAG: hypothetical protein NT007_17275 [Candidatus Kapabacteria bacterium]|nr:hypothetical protein [Candidatus Kapabacteria bacterium]